MDEPKRETVGDLRQLLRQAEVDCAYWRGRAEAVETLMSQRSQQPPTGGTNLPPELLTSMLLAKMKEKKDGGDAQA